MLNYIWFLMLLFGMLLTAVNGVPQDFSKAVFDGAASSVNMVLEMSGTVIFWMGVLKIAEKSGMIKLIAAFFRPVVSRLFPSLPKNSPALGSVILNVSANFFGLGNAATPFGIKAMTELKKINKNSNTASDDMITFLILNTSAITVIPTMVISMRAEMGSSIPEEIIIPSLMASFMGLVAGLICHGILKRFF